MMLTVYKTALLYRLTVPIGKTYCILKEGSLATLARGQAFIAHSSPCISDNMNSEEAYSLLSVKGIDLEHITHDHVIYTG